MKRYEKEGIDDQIYYDTLEDLKFKLIECFNVEGAWGITPSPGSTISFK